MCISVGGGGVFNGLICQRNHFHKKVVLTLPKCSQSFVPEQEDEEGNMLLNSYMVHAELHISNFLKLLFLEDYFIKALRIRCFLKK